MHRINGVIKIFRKGPDSLSGGIGTTVGSYRSLIVIAPVNDVNLIAVTLSMLALPIPRLKSSEKSEFNVDKNVATVYYFSNRNI